MVRKAYKFYKKLIDKKIDNPTVIVLIISFLIILVWFLAHRTDANLYAKNNVLEYSVVDINWEKYEVTLKKSQ